MRKERIAVDMDEVMADSIARFQAWHWRDFRAELSREALHGRPMREAVAADRWPTVQQYPHAPGFFEDLPVMEHSQTVLRQLAARYELFVASAAMEFPGSFRHKYEWLQTHFPFIPWQHYVFCGDKSILAADYLIDDNAYNLRAFRGEGILFSAPHNAGETGFRRANDWLEVARMFL